MQALILTDETAESDRLGRALARRGFMVAAFAEPEPALDFVRTSVTDLVILKQVIGGSHTTSVALAAEYYHPRCASLLLCRRNRVQASELFDHVPSLQAVLGERPDAALLTTLALHAVQNPAETLLVLSPLDRVHRSTPLRAA